MNTYSKLLTGLLVAAFAVALVPSANAQANLPGGGTFVGPADVDTTYALTAVGAPVFTTAAFIDTNSDGSLQAGEPVYLHRGAGTKVIQGDVRLTSAFGNAGGSIVSGTADDFDRNLVLFGAEAYCFFDADTNALYNLGDTLYLNIAADTLVSINDVPLMGTGAFTSITTSSAGYNQPLNCVAGFAVGAVEMFFNADGDAGYSTADTVYLNIGSGATVVGIGDIRLTKLASAAAGVQVTATDLETTYSLAAPVAVGGIGGPYSALCYVDVNTNAVFNSGEPMYLQDFACGVDSVAAGDLRLVGTQGFVGGTLVKGSDDDFARDTVGTGLGAPVYCFFDADGSGAYSLNDPVFVDIGAVLGTVTINDIIVSGSQAFTTVVSGNSNLNNACSTVGMPALFAETIFDADGIGTTARTTGDFVYLDIDANAAPSINDLRLTKVGSLAAGSQVKVGDIDVQYGLTAATPGFGTVCFVDTDGDGVQDSNEGAYLVAACGTIAAGSVRLVTVGSLPGGTVVKGSDDDFSRNTVALPAAGLGCLAYYDANGNGAYDYQEAVFIDFAAACAAANAAQGTVTANDIQVTGSGAFQRVTGSTSGLNNPLLGFPIALAALSSFNADGIAAGAWTVGDTIYADIGADGFPSVGDVRIIGLNGLGAGQIGGDVGGNVGGTGTSTGTSTSTATSTGTSTATSTGTSTPTSNTQTSSNVNTATGGNDDGEDSDDDKKTPGFELVALVAALGAALVLVRRKL